MDRLPHFKKPNERISHYDFNRTVDALQRQQAAGIANVRTKPYDNREKGNGVIFKITAGPEEVEGVTLYRGKWQSGTSKTLNDISTDAYILCPNTPKGAANGKSNGKFCTAIDVGLTIRVKGATLILWVTTDELRPLTRFGIVLSVRNKHGLDNPKLPRETIPIHRYSGVYLDNYAEPFTDIVTMQNREPNVRYWWHFEGSVVQIVTLKIPGVKSARGRGLASDDLAINPLVAETERTVIITPEAEFHTLELCSI